MGALPVKSAITFDKLYRNNVLVAEDVTVEIPELMLKTATTKAMGDMNVPLLGLLDGDIEIKVTKTGISYESHLLDLPVKASYKLCNVQQVTTITGDHLPEPIKIYFSGSGKGVAGFTITPGESADNDHTIVCHSIQSFVDGMPYVHIDRLLGIYKIGETDYMIPTQAMLI